MTVRGPAAAGPLARHETAAQRADRMFDELLQELRVAQTGVQILFAFLLGTAFTRPLRSSDDFVHALLAVDLLLAAGASALLIAPVAVHRALLSRHRKGEVVRLASALARAGLLFLMLAIIGSCLLALDAVLSRLVAVVISAVVLLVYAGLWIVLPLWARHHGDRVDDAT